MKRIKILARKNLKMSAGKLAAQCVHAALALVAQGVELDPMMSVVVLEVNSRPFDDAKSNSPKAIIRDAGFTEVAPGTETVIAFLEDDPRSADVDILTADGEIDLFKVIEEMKTVEPEWAQILENAMDEGKTVHIIDNRPKK